jgi:plastocyanin
MAKKSRKRREAERRKIERAVEAAPSTPEEETLRLQRARAKAEHEAERLRRKAKREHAATLNPIWLAVAGGGGLIAAVVFGVLLLVGGGGDGGAAATPTLNPVIGTATPAASVSITAQGEEDGSTFSPNTLTIQAGVVTEIVITNVATRVSHNMRVSGEDGEYETDDPKNLKDDFAIPLIEAGDTGSLIVKIDTPGSYKFQCDFHPVTQKGTLVVQ